MLIYQRVTYTYNDAGESKRMKSTRVDYLPSQFEGHMVAAFENIFKNINHDKISLCNRIVCWHSFFDHGSCDMSQNWVSEDFGGSSLRALFF
jgi:hypothetical protein